METLIVTGGAGFIGCNFVRLALAETRARIVVVDALTYAGSLENLKDVAQSDRYAFLRADIADRGALTGIFKEFQPSAVVNFAAETHVDRSIDDPGNFVRTNVSGAFELLEGSRRYVAGLPPELKDAFRFLHVSTDEVYGSLGPSGQFTEQTPYAPNSPYAASKAAADHFVRAYHETYGLPTLLTNCSNNFGPYQFPEKLIPLTILNAIEGKPLPIYGDGGNVRDWLHVEDHCEGVLLVLRKGSAGEKYNIGGGGERRNVDVVDRICSALEAQCPPGRNEALLARGIGSYAELKTFVRDRPGHDRRYAIDASKIAKELGWRPKRDFETGIKETVSWYLANRDWCHSVQAGRYGRERLGLGGVKA